MTGEIQSLDQWQSKVRLLKQVIEDWKDGKITIERIQEVLENFTGMDYVLAFKKAANQCRDVGEILDTILTQIGEEEYIIEASQAPRTGDIRDSEFGPPDPTARLPQP